MTTKSKTRIFMRAVAFLLASAAAATAAGETVVREFQGSDSMTTADFQVRAPWIVDWIVNGEFQEMLGFQVTLIDAGNGRHVGQIVKVTERGNGVRMFEQSGRYRLRIDSTLARWQIKVVELSRSEAERYTPRGTAAGAKRTGR